MVKSEWRGNKIYFDGKEWRYLTDGTRVYDNVNIKCGHCSKSRQKMAVIDVSEN